MKKIISLVLVLVLALTAIGGTLAYFTDTDNATNTFTIGGVKIDLIEQQRAYDKEGNVLEDLVDYEETKNVMPIVGSAQDGKDPIHNLPTAKNYFDKIITVENTGKSPAFIRVFVAKPAGLDKDPARDAILHFNYNRASMADGEWTDDEMVFENYEIDGIQYNIYMRTYTTAVKAEESTATPAYVGGYIDSRVDMKDGKYTFDGNEITTFDLNNGFKILVFAQAVQSEGFDSAAAAFAASGLPTNPWAK